MNQNNKEFKKDYDYNVSQAKKILKGEVNSTLNSLNEKMNDLSKEYKYEEAAKTRDIISSLNELSHNQTIYSLKEENILVFNYMEINKHLYLGYTKVIDGLPQEVFYLEIKDTFKEYSIEELLTTYIETEVDKIGLLKIITPIVLPHLFYKYEGKKHTTQSIEWLNFVKNNLQTILEEKLKNNLQQFNYLQELKNIFQIPIFSIECIDISHFQGEATYGGKINWAIKNKEGNLEKNKYRLAKMEDRVIDDIEHMYNTVERIYHNDNDMPSILIIDGDKPQLEAAFKALKEKELKKDYILLSSAKGVSRKKV